MWTTPGVLGLWLAIIITDWRFEKGRKFFFCRQIAILGLGENGKVEVLGTYRNACYKLKNEFLRTPRFNVSLYYPAHRKPKIPHAFWPNLRRFEGEKSPR
jgi:hypothetical protein